MNSAGRVSLASIPPTVAAARKTASGRAWVAWLRARLRRASVQTNDYVFGLYDSGAMDTDRTLALLRRLPRGVTEFYFHPATGRCPELDRDMPDYQHQAELQALLSPKVRAALAADGAERIGYRDLAAGTPAAAHPPSEMTKCSAS